MKIASVFCVPRARTSWPLWGLMMMLTLATIAFAAPAGRQLASPQGGTSSDVPTHAVRGVNSLDALGDPVNFNTSLANAATYLRNMQSSTDGGWDWVRTGPPFTHSADPSATNLYGACALGLYYDYLRTSNVTDMSAMTLAANQAVGDPAIHDASVLKFLMLYQDLSGVPANTYKNAAKTKYDAFKALHGPSGTAMAEYMRDNRGISQGYHNGIIGWDLGAWAVAADMLNSRFGGQGYDTDADQIADVAYNASFVTNANYFDLVRCAGWDNTYANTDFWWYNLGVSGLIDAFRASNTHTSDIAGLVQKLRDSETSFGAICGSYGVHANDDDWQSSAYAVMTLAALNPVTYLTDINHAAYYIGATQDVSGGWLYGDNSHYPELAGENASALYFGAAPTAVWVDATYNSVNHGTHVWGYDAFATIQNGINAVHGSIVNVAAGTYEEQLHITTNNLQLVGAGVGSTFINSPVSLPLYYTTSAANYPVVFVDGVTGVGISNLTVNGLGRAAANYRMQGIGYWNSGGSISNVRVTGIRENPANGMQQGVGIYAYNNTGGPYVINITDVTVDDYQKGGITMNGAGLTAHILRTTTTGYGPVAFIAQNGIQFGYGASGTATNCNVTGHTYTGPVDDFSCGILVYQGGSMVTVTGSTLNANQAGVYFLDTDGSVVNSTVLADANSYYGVAGDKSDATPLRNDSDHRNTLRHRRANPATESPSRSNHNLDTDHSFSVSGSTITGNNIAYNPGVTGFSFSGNLTVAVQNNAIRNWGYGVVMYTCCGGTINTASVSGNQLGNIVNTTESTGYPDTPGRWTNNCYSDYASNPGYSSGHYWIPDWDYTLNNHVQTDLNPNLACANVITDMVASPYIGCSGGSCPNDTLYLMFDLAGYYSGQLILQLPAGLSSYLTPVMTDVMPPIGPLRTANLQHAFARSLGGGQIEINPLWGALNPSVADLKYFAAIPVLNTGFTHGQTITISPVSYDFVNASGEHTTDLILASLTITVDCQAPTATLTGGAGEPSCNSYNSSAEFLNALTYSMSAGSPPNSPLNQATIVLNGTTTWSVLTTGGTWPLGTETPNVFNTMTEGCNTFVLHVKDTECNEGISTPIINVVKDITPPSLSVNLTPPPNCFSNDQTSPTYGGTTLDNALDITTVLGTGCVATSGMLTISYQSDPNTFTRPLDVTNYPAADSSGLALWTWIMARVPGANGGSYTFDVKAADCAGNFATGSFTICVDLTPPSNTFTVFDARPTYGGVWLKWVWAGGPGIAAMEIWRKPEWFTGEPDSANNAYPVYNLNKSLDLSTYEKVHANLAANGWSMAATQAADNVPADFTAAAYTGGGNIHHTDGVLGTYWKDAIDDATARSIYRYVTFVKDSAGNWSQVGSYALLTNADRSTNYWLGDYVWPDYPGVVNTEDLQALSTHYFEAVLPAFNKLDIGPENHENAYGKGIPNPDQYIDFNDLVPFSFNYGVVSSTGFLTEPNNNRPFNSLDNSPVVSMARTSEGEIHTGGTFTVTLALGGNDHSVKDVEAVLKYDADVLELVSAEAGSMEVSNGIPWSTARAVTGENGKVVVAAAAMGAIAVMNGDGPLATLQFRWKSDHAPQTNLELISVKMSDDFGGTTSSSGSILGLGAQSLLPTAYALYQNYPNPFNPTTTLAFDLKADGFVRLTVYNLLGQEVAKVVNGTMQAGRHTVNFDASGLSSGLYLYKIEVNGFTALHKMMLLR